MANFNKVILAGYLADDPVLRKSNLCSFTIAVNEVWTDKKSGQRNQETCFIDVVAFNRQAILIENNFSKGKPIIIEGKLKYRTWASANGSQKGKHEIVIDRFSYVEKQEKPEPNASYTPQNGRIDF